MALKATIFKAEISIANMDSHYYGTHQLIIARHPSETDERMMMRLLAFALNANDALSFTKGLSTDDEPELWQKSLSNEIELWIELGSPDENRIRKACNRAQQVIIYCYGGSAAELWWKRTAQKLTRFTNLTVLNVSKQTAESMSKMAARSMQLSYNIEEQEVNISNEQQSLSLVLENWQTRAK